ncbi:MAG TPA: type II toxin-antitoxin system HicB family antitoxin [Longimicrobium sp.]|jgi:predicted RNase H-like HicB family nuclease
MSFEQGLGPSLLTPCKESGQVQFQIELEREEDGRWIAEVPDLPGVLVYGRDRADAVARVQALALRVLAERLEHGEAVPEPLSVSFLAA